MKLNSKGDIPSMILAAVLIFIVAIILIFFWQVRTPFYDTLDEYLEENEDYNDTEAHQAIQEIGDVERSIWDYAFLALMFGVVISLIMTAFATRIHPAFFWAYIIASIVIVVLGAIISNMWQGVADNPEMAEAIAAFPITNTVLGSNFSVFIAAFMFIFIIVLFGKTPGGAGGLR